MLQRTLELDVDAAPRPRLLVGERPHLAWSRRCLQNFVRQRRQYRRAADGRVERAVGNQHRVAQFLSAKSAHPKTGEQIVGRVLGKFGFARHARHAVSGTGHHQAVHRLEAAALLDHGCCKPIEQLGIGGRLAEATEIVGRRHDSHAKVMLPKAIDDGAPCQAVARVDHPVGEGKSATRALAVCRLHRRLGRKARRHHRHSRLNHIAERVRTAADHHPHFTRRRHFAHGQNRLALPVGRAHRAELRMQLLEALRRRLACARCEIGADFGHRRKAERDRAHRLFAQHAVVEPHFVDVTAERASARKHRADGELARSVEPRLGTARAINGRAVDVKRDGARCPLAGEGNMVPTPIVVARA